MPRRFLGLAFAGAFGHLRRAGAGTLLVRADGNGLFVQDQSGLNDDVGIGTGQLNNSQTAYAISNKNAGDVFKFDFQVGCSEHPSFGDTALCFRSGPNFAVALGNDHLGMGVSPLGSPTVTGGPGNDALFGQLDADTHGNTGNDELHTGLAVTRSTAAMAPTVSRPAKTTTRCVAATAPTRSSAARATTSCAGGPTTTSSSRGTRRSDVDRRRRGVRDGLRHRGRRMVETDVAEARQAFDSIEATARSAVAEMRRLLGLLRSDDEQLALAPQPSLVNLEALVAQVREAGLPVEVTVEGQEAELPPGVDLSAYRIVQEGLTNVLKHAGPARAGVYLRYRPDDIEVEIVDDGPGKGNGGARGHGLTGMRERVALYGGELDVGRGPEGGYALRARLPLESTRR